MYVTHVFYELGTLTNVQLLKRMHLLACLLVVTTPQSALLSTMIRNAISNSNGLLILPRIGRPLLFSCPSLSSFFLLLHI